MKIFILSVFILTAQLSLAVTTTNANKLIYVKNAIEGQYLHNQLSKYTITDLYLRDRYSNFIPIIGQIMWLTRRYHDGAAHDVDNEIAVAKLSKDGKEFNLNCVLRSFKYLTANEDLSEEQETIYFTPMHCELENPTTGIIDSVTIGTTVDLANIHQGSKYIDLDRTEFTPTEYIKNATANGKMDGLSDGYNPDFEFDELDKWDKGFSEGYEHGFQDGYGDLKYQDIDWD